MPEKVLLKGGEGGRGNWGEGESGNNQASNLSKRSAR